MSSPDPQAQSDRPRWTAISIALLVLGLLIVVPAGLCVVAIAVGEGLNDPEFILIALMTGGIPLAGGIGLIYAALKMRARNTPNEQSAPTGTPHWTVASIALFVLGLLILVPSGLCTALVGGSIVVEGLANADLTGIPIVLIYGGVPAAIGAALVYAALKIRRQG